MTRFQSVRKDFKGSLLTLSLSVHTTKTAMIAKFVNKLPLVMFKLTGLIDYTWMAAHRHSVCHYSLIFDYERND